VRERERGRYNSLGRIERRRASLSPSSTRREPSRRRDKTPVPVRDKRNVPVRDKSNVPHRDKKTVPHRDNRDR